MRFTAGEFCRSANAIINWDVQDYYYITILSESPMTYRVQTTVKDPWVFWSIAAILWFILTVVAWPHVGWLLRVVLLVFFLWPLIGLFFFLKPYTDELVVDDGTISWGDQPYEIIDIKRIRRIVRDEDKGMTFFELEGERFLTKLPWMFDGRDLCDYIKQNYTQVKIESKPDRTNE